MRRFTMHHDGHASGTIGSTKRWFWLVTLVVIGFSLIVGMRPSRMSTRRQVSYITEPMARMSPKKMQATAAENAVLGGIMAGRRAQMGTATTSAPGEGSGPEVIMRSPWEPGLKGPVIRITHIRGAAPQLTRDAAMNDALDIGRGLLLEKLQAVDPPIKISLTNSQIRERYLRIDTVKEIHPSEVDKEEMSRLKVEENRIWLEIELEVSADQLRVIRSEQRLGEAAKSGLILFELMIVVHVILRLIRRAKRPSQNRKSAID